MKRKKRDKRGPGRPAGAQSTTVRQALLDATRALCIERGLDATSTKAISERAGVNPAMINYYFGNKEALCLAMMRDAMQPVIAELDAACNADPSSITLPQFVTGYMRALAGNPWLPRLVVREVLPENGRFRELFFSELADRAGRLLGLLGQPAGPRGRQSTNDPRLRMISVMSLAVFPFLAAPVLETVLAIDLRDEGTVTQLIAQTLGVLSGGIEAAGAA